MKKYATIIALVLVCLTVVSGPQSVNAQKGNQGGGGSAPVCAGITVSTSSPQVTRGYNVGVVAMVTNCSSSKQRSTVQLTMVSACGAESAIGYNRTALEPGQSIQVTAAYPIYENACPGVYTVKATASVSRTVLSSATTTFTVL